MSDLSKVARSEKHPLIGSGLNEFPFNGDVSVGV